MPFSLSSDLLNWRPLCIGRPRPVYSDRNEVDILLHTVLRLPLTSGPDCLPLARQGVPRATLAATTAQLLTSQLARAKSAGVAAPAQQDKAVKTRVHFRAAQFIPVRCNSAESGIQFLSVACARFHWLSGSQAITASRLICAAPSAALPQPAGARFRCGAEAGSCLPLLHEGPATRDGPDQALIGEHLDGSPHGHRGQARFLNQIDDARDLPSRRVHPGLDPLPQDGSQLLERELGRIMINLHVITLASMIM